VVSGQQAEGVYAGDSAAGSTGHDTTYLAWTLSCSQLTSRNGAPARRARAIFALYIIYACVDGCAYTGRENPLRRCYISPQRALPFSLHALLEHHLLIKMKNAALSSATRISRAERESQVLRHGATLRGGLVGTGCRRPGSPANGRSCIALSPLTFMAPRLIDAWAWRSYLAALRR